MRFQRLRSKISELQEITNTWQESTSISQLEMDMALDRVKQIYELLRFESVEAKVDNLVVETVDNSVEPMPDSSLVAAVEDVAERIAEATVGLVEIFDNDSNNNNESESAEKESVTTNNDSQLNKRERYNRILSLYGDESDDESEEPIVDTATDELPIESNLEQIVKTESEQPVAISEPRQLMSIQLTLNDRFLLSHDLFNDDMDALNLTLAQLDSQPSYDDAIIFIAENYSWDGNSAGAQILITLLKSRFSLN